MGGPFSLGNRKSELAPEPFRSARASWGDHAHYAWPAHSLVCPHASLIRGAHRLFEAAVLAVRAPPQA